LIFAFEQAELQMASHKSVSVVVAANWSEFAQRSALRARQQMAEDVDPAARQQAQQPQPEECWLLNAVLCSAAMAIDADCQLHSKK